MNTNSTAKAEVGVSPFATATAICHAEAKKNTPYTRRMACCRTRSLVNVRTPRASAARPIESRAALGSIRPGPPNWYASPTTTNAAPPTNRSAR